MRAFPQEGMSQPRDNSHRRRRLDSPLPAVVAAETAETLGMLRPRVDGLERGMELDQSSRDALARSGLSIEQISAVVAQVLEEEHAAVATAAAAVVSVASLSSPRLQPQGMKRRLEYQFEIDECVKGMSQKEVYTAFRMGTPDLYELLDALRPHLVTHNPEKGVAGCGHATTAGQRLLCGLRMMFGAAYQDVQATLPPISQGRVFDALWWVVDAINKVYSDTWKFPMPPPTEDESVGAFLDRQEPLKCLQELERRNALSSPKRIWRGQVRAIDGAIMKMGNPGVAVPVSSAGCVGCAGCAGRALIVKLMSMACVAFDLRTQSPTFVSGSAASRCC